MTCVIILYHIIILLSRTQNILETRAEHEPLPYFPYPVFATIGKLHPKPADDITERFRFNANRHKEQAKSKQ